MKEVLFRGKCVNTDEWVEGFPFKTILDGIELWCIGNEPLLVNDYSETVGENVRWFIIDPETLCQFTGLIDKKGKKIFENDIIHRPHHKEDDCIVTWCDGRYCFKTIYGQYNQDPMTLLSLCFIQQAVESLSVIGNIFDNPELIGK